MEKNDKPAVKGKAGGKGAEQNKALGATTVSSSSLDAASIAGLAASSNLGDSQGATELAGDVVDVSAASSAGADQARIERAMEDGVKAVRVTAPHDGYRRAGRAWLRSEVHVPLGELSDQQLQHLVTDPSLTVTPVYSEQPQASE